jgi:DNA-binding protein YbaB
VGADRDGLVTVTVSSAGALVDIELDERVGGQPVREIRRRILEAFESAQTSLAREVAKATAQTLGMRNPTSDAIVTAFTKRINHIGDGDDHAR